MIKIITASKTILEQVLTTFIEILDSSFTYKTTYLKLLHRLAGRPEQLGGQICQIGQIGKIGWEDHIGWDGQIVLGGQMGGPGWQKRAFARTQAKKKQVKTLAWGPDWLGGQISQGSGLAGGQIGWEVRLAGSPDWIIPSTNHNQSRIVDCPIID